jgi:hypothetical protein
MIGLPRPGLGQLVQAALAQGMKPRKGSGDGSVYGMFGSQADPLAVAASYAYGGQGQRLYRQGR